ncbi:MAG: plasmid mobilization protein [Candidatus Binataceae bacterium]
MAARKPRAERKNESIRIRVTSSQKRVLTEAATRSGLEVSSWLRSLALGAASLEVAGKRRTLERDR